MTFDVVLAIDTSTEQCSVALKKTDQWATRAVLAPREHSQLILPLVQEVLAELEVTLADVNALVVGYGPGSFTGVRISVAIAQGLAFSHNIPVIPVSTLTGLAQQAIRVHDARQVVSAIDARMHEVYVAAYREHRGLAVPVCNAQMAGLVDITSQSWWGELDNSQAIVGVGTGWRQYAEQLNACQQVQILEDITLPLAEDLLSWGIQCGKIIAASELEPLYVRNEVAWQKLPGRG